MADSDSPPINDAIRGGRGMNLTPEQAAQGRRNFMKILAGTPALAALGVSAALRGPVAGGPVRVGFIGVGGQGRSLLRNVDPVFADLRAMCDINPTSLALADKVLVEGKRPPAPTLCGLARDAAEGRHRSRDHGAPAWVP